MLLPYPNRNDVDHDGQAPTCSTHVRTSHEHLTAHKACLSITGRMPSADDVLRHAQPERPVSTKLVYLLQLG